MGDELVKKIEKVEQILDQFAREEINNKLSQFAMIALKEMILNELRFKENKKEEVKNDKAISK
jgi:hypothetical protein